jgi:hypothetical protein
MLSRSANPEMLRNASSAGSRISTNVRSRPSTTTFDFIRFLRGKAEGYVNVFGNAAAALEFREAIQRLKPLS